MEANFINIAEFPLQLSVLSEALKRSQDYKITLDPPLFLHVSSSLFNLLMKETASP